MRPIDELAKEFLGSALSPPFTGWLALLSDDFKYSIQNGPGLDKKHLLVRLDFHSSPFAIDPLDILFIHAPRLCSRVSLPPSPISVMKLPL